MCARGWVGACTYIYTNGIFFRSLIFKIFSLEWDCLTPVAVDILVAITCLFFDKIVVSQEKPITNHNTNFIASSANINFVAGIHSFTNATIFVLKVEGKKNYFQSSRK